MVFILINPTKRLILYSFSLLAILSMIVTPLKAQEIIQNQQQNQSFSSATDLLQSGQKKIQDLDYRGAILDLSQSILLNPEIADSYFYRGLVRAKLEDQLGAISDFDDAILRDPNHSWAYYHRAGVFFNLGNQSEGILDLQLAAKLFLEQGNTTAYQQTEALLKHFGVTLPQS